MEIKELYWAAGFIEGEGFFPWYKRSTGIRVTQTQEELIQKLKNMFGGSAKERKFKKVGKAKRQWEWSLYGPRGRGLMFTIFSMMSEKRKKEIKRSINGWKGPRKVIEKKRFCKRGHEFNFSNTWVYNNGLRGCKKCQKMMRKGGNRRSRGKGTNAQESQLSFF